MSNERAHSVMVQETYQDMIRFAERHLRMNGVDAQDAAMHAMEIGTRMGNWHRPYLHVAMKHYHLKGRQRNREDATDVNGMMTLLGATFPTQELYMEVVDALRAVEAMPPVLRRIMRLLSQGWEGREIADNCNLTLSNVNRRVMEGRKLLREKELHDIGARQFFGIRRARQKWEARVTVDGRTKHIGMFDTALDAALAYDVMARKLGRRMNFPDSERRGIGKTRANGKMNGSHYQTPDKE
jgi:DNA-directed RNA polymerase specialized sigma24 family protein